MSPERLSYFVVIRKRGGPWDWSRRLEEQELWTEHALFMEELVDSGFVVLGGPLGDGRQAMLVVDAESKEEIQSRLAPDPWTESGMLTTASIEPWEIRLDGRG